jgi:hypothetical protein
LRCSAAAATNCWLGASKYEAWRADEISFADFDASVQGWINHVRYADTWGLRQHVLQRFDLAGMPPKDRR